MVLTKSAQNRRGERVRNFNRAELMNIQSIWKPWNLSVTCSMLVNSHSDTWIGAICVTAALWYLHMTGCSIFSIVNKFCPEYYHL